LGETAVAQVESAAAGRVAVADEPAAVLVWAVVELAVPVVAAVVRVEFQVERDEPEAGSDDCRDAQGAFPVDQALPPADRAGPVGSVADCWVDLGESPADPDD